MKRPFCLLVSASIVICAACLAGNYAQTMSISEPIDQVYVLLDGTCKMTKVVDHKGRIAAPDKPIDINPPVEMISVGPEGQGMGEEMNIILGEAAGTYKLFVEGKTGRKYWLNVDVSGTRDSKEGAFTFILKQKKACIAFKVKGGKLTVTPADAKLFRKEKKK